MNYFIKVFAPTTTAFFVGILLTPFLTHYLYKYKLWKKKSGKVAPDGSATPIFNQLHASRDTGTPRLGGIIIWLSTLVTVSLFSFTSLNFLSREQTWLPLFTLLIGSLVGLVDDIFQVTASPEKAAKAGLAFKTRLFLVMLLGLGGGWWFFAKLGISTIFVPLWGPISIGWLIIPLFAAVMAALFSSGAIDGLDGLAGGVMAIIFAAYTGIAYFQDRFDLATFCAVITGALLAFLWFNIPPARFYMSETGILGLTTTLTVVAFLTDSVAILPLIALPLVATSLSIIIQLLSKKLRQGQKVFLVAPLHHHFEALGWPASKVVMRYWVISIIFAIIGMILTLLSK